MAKLVYSENFTNIKSMILMVIKAGIDLAVEPNAEIRKYHEINYEMLTKQLDELLLTYTQKPPISLRESEQYLDSALLKVHDIVSDNGSNLSLSDTKKIERLIRLKAIEMKHNVQKRICYDY